jgi:hypothetical protein
MYPPERGLTAPIPTSDLTTARPSTAYNEADRAVHHHQHDRKPLDKKKLTKPLIINSPLILLQEFTYSINKPLLPVLRTVTTKHHLTITLVSPPSNTDYIPPKSPNTFGKGKPRVTI